MIKRLNFKNTIKVDKVIFLKKILYKVRKLLAKFPVSCVYYRTIPLIFMVFFSLNTNGQTLQEYIQEAEQNNPKIKALQKQHESAVEKVNSIGGLPNTSLGAGYFVSEQETRMGPQIARFNAWQELPWLGIVKAKKNKEKSISEVTKNEIEITRKKIILEIKEQYYELYALKAEEQLTNKQKEVLENYKETTRSQVINNNVSEIQALQIDIKQNELDNTIEVLKGKILNAEIRFNKLLDRDGFDILVVPNNLFIPEEEPTLSIDEVTYHPKLLKYDFLNGILDEEKEVNNKERLPKISVGIEYTIVQERPDLVFADNGKDVMMPMISLSIPLFSKKHTSIKKQYELQQESYVQEREYQQNLLEKVLEQALNNRITARINYDTQQKNKQQTKKVEALITIAYRADQEKFTELLQIQEMLLDFEIKKIRAIKDYFLQTAIINYLE